MSKEIDKILMGCFSPARGKANLRKVKANPKIAEKHIKKAHQNLRAMRLMYSSDLFDWTVICGYYAMYHAVLASLFKIGIKATAHYCAIAAFKKFYIERDKVGAEYINYIEKACQLERKYAESLDSAQQTRVTEQYGVEVFTNDDAEWIIEDSEEFVLKIEEVLAE
ncbi:MAG: HEPN domain-containing protein [Elusimicrobiota bacterium]